VLRGDEGVGVQRAMELLVALGEAFEAERLVGITSAHVSGVSYKNIGDVGLDLLKDLAKLGSKVKVLTTTNPCGMDLKRWREMGVRDEDAEKQFEVLKCFKRLGVKTTCTCTPYLIGFSPRFGDRLAWAESSAIIYANSVLGARTNRESGISALAAAIVGKTPFYGMHLDANRRYTAVVKVDVKLDEAYRYGALGYLVSNTLKSGVPLILGLKRPTIEKLKALSAALGTSASITMFQAPGITPETPKVDLPMVGVEKITVNGVEIKQLMESFQSSKAPDLIFLGCPHCGLNELRNLATFLEGRRVKSGKKLWICTSRRVKAKALKLECIDTIERAGGKVFTDTCLVVALAKDIYRLTIATDSFKAAHYLRSLHRAEVTVNSWKHCLENVT